MIFRAAGATLHEIPYAADGYDRNDEEKRDKAHTLLLRKIPDRAAVTTAHLRRHWLRAP